MVKQLASELGRPDTVICLLGLMAFGSWLLRTSWGRNALVDSVPRRNNMPFYMPFVPLVIWLAGAWLAVSTTRILAEDMDDWQSAFLDNLALCLSSLVTLVVIIFLARATFARRLKGFGLNIKTIHRDFLVAAVNLFSIWPLLLVAIILTTRIGKFIWGQEYEMPRHEELDLMATYSQWPVRVLIIVAAVAIGPVIEEVLFRGLFQSVIRSYLENSTFDVRSSKLRALGTAWPSIAISSIFFAMVHQNVGHWPALFVLALCLGYSYEKSGSLFRPIFIHALFNGITLAAVLSSSA
jgi:membrane protease YdiL (CAAX protease family)